MCAISRCLLLPIVRAISLVVCVCACVFVYVTSLSMNIFSRCPNCWDISRHGAQIKVRGVKIELEEVERIIAGILQRRLDQEGVLDAKEGLISGEVLTSASESGGGEAVGGSERILGGDGERKIAKIGTTAVANIRVKEGLAVAAVSDVDRRSHHLVLVLQSNLAHQMRLDTPLAVRRYLLYSVESAYVPLSVLLVDRIPRTTTGKIDRPSINESAALTVTGAGAGKETTALTGSQEGSSMSGLREGLKESSSGSKVCFSKEAQGSSAVSEYSEATLLEVSSKIYDIYVKALRHLSCGPMAEGALEYIGLLLRSHESRLGGESPALTAMRKIDPNIDIVRTLDFFSLGGDSMSAQPALYYLNALMMELHRPPTQGHTQHLPHRKSPRGLKMFTMQHDVMTLARILLDGNHSTFYDTERSLRTTEQAAMIDEKSLKRKIGAESAESHADISPVKRSASFSNESRSSTNSRNTDRSIDLRGAKSLLSKVSVYGRTARWDWFPKIPVNHTDFNRADVEVRHDSVQGAQDIQDPGPLREGGSRSRSDKVGLTQYWSRAMKRCVDSSPLIITLHYGGVPQQLMGAATVQGSADCRDGKESRGVAIGKGGGDGDKVRNWEGDWDRNREGESSLGRVYIGSHGGDFSALDAQTGSLVWTVDLESDFNSRMVSEIKDFSHGLREQNRVGQKKQKRRKRQCRVHVEGSASSNVTGSVVYVGCFRGDDVDGVQGEGEGGGSQGECPRS
jgi:PQQ enzyme repeat